MGKLTKVQVIIIGVLVNIIVVAGAVFGLLKPRYENYQQTMARLEEVRATADDLENARADKERAIKERIEAEIRYREYEVAKMPAISFTDRTIGMIGMWREQSEVLGPMVEQWPRRFGVELLNNISVPAASSNPNDASFQASPIRLDLGTMQVRGDYRSLLRHFAGWNQFGRLVEIGPPSFSGTSPNLTVSYTLAVIIYPRGEPGPQVAIAGAAADAQGGAGAMGGMGGMPPAPGAMPPGPGAGPMPPGAMSPVPGGASDAPPPPGM